VSLLLAVAITLQASSWAVTPARPTVGDTVRVVRRIAAPPGAEVRLAPLAETEAVVPLEGPGWRDAGGEVIVTYTVAVFRPGATEVRMPAITILPPDGRALVLADEAVAITVRPVLPPDSVPAPRPSLAPIGRRVRHMLPVAVLLLPTLALVGAWGAFRRHASPRPAPEAPTGATAEPPLDRWLAAGESRAVAGVAARRLRAAVLRRAPGVPSNLETERLLAALEATRADAPVREIADLLRALDRARFAPAAPAAIADVVDGAERLVAELQ
jgi:hypothetical protein